MEIWKDIPDYEGLYQVSNKGNVKSLNWKNRGISKNLYLKKHNKGYLQVELVKNKKTKMFLVHRLVAIAFIENPFLYKFINHKDENKLNNSVSNLEWCSSSYNNKYSLDLHPERKYNRKSSPKYKQNFTKKITQFTTENVFVKEWNNSREIFVQTGMSDWSISQCCRGKRKTAYGYMWRYST
jgi:hypothetical protein